MERIGSPLRVELSGSCPQPQKRQPDPVGRFIAKLLRTVPKSREQICDEITTISGFRLSRRMLDDWTRKEGRYARFPASLVFAFCLAAKDDGLLLFIMGPERAQLLRLGQAVAATVSKSEWKRFLAKFKKQLSRRGKR